MMAGVGVTILDHEVNLTMETKPVGYKLEGSYCTLLERERNFVFKVNIILHFLSFVDRLNSNYYLNPFSHATLKP